MSDFLCPEYIQEVALSSRPSFTSNLDFSSLDSSVGGSRFESAPSNDQLARNCFQVKHCTVLFACYLPRVFIYLSRVLIYLHKTILSLLTFLSSSPPLPLLSSFFPLLLPLLNQSTSKRLDRVRGSHDASYSTTKRLNLCHQFYIDPNLHDLLLAVIHQTKNNRVDRKFAV